MDSLNVTYPNISGCKYIQSFDNINSQNIIYNNLEYVECYAKIILKLNEQELNILQVNGMIPNTVLRGYEMDSCLDNKDGTITINAFYLNPYHPKNPDVGMTVHADLDHGYFYYPSKGQK